MAENPLQEFSQEQQPYSMEAEQSVLGAILLEPECIAQVLEYLSPESFYRQQHKELFAIMLAMFTSAQPIDVVTVLEQAKKDRVFPGENEVKVYLTQLAQTVPSIINVESYAKVVQEKYYLRSLIGIARDIISHSTDGDSTARNLMEFAEHKLFELRQGKDSGGLVRVDRAIYELYDHLQRLSGEDKDAFAGISTGFSALDQVTTGLNRSDLILLAARPAMGKSTFAFNIAANVAKQGKTVAIFSLEMSREQVVSKLLSTEALIQGTAMRTGNLSADEWTRLAISAQTIAKMSLYIDDTPGITVAEMKAKLRRLRELDLVIIDYLQLMASGRRIENRVQEVSEVTRNLKIAAKELNVPLVVLSQLSRGPDKRTEHRPVLSDLRESGSIEQDADLVMFLYRDEYYEENTEDKGLAECILAKNRHGSTDTVKIAFDGAHSRFMSREIYRDAP